MAKECKKLRFRCKTCKKSFSTKYILSQHCLKQHNAFLPFSCKVCFKKRGKRKASSSLQTEVESPQPKDSPARKKKAQPKEKKFMHLSVLQQHAKLHSTHVSYKCQICEKEFSKRLQIAKHTIYHHRQCPYRCHKCGRLFELQRQLSFHLWKQHRILYRKLPSEIRRKIKFSKAPGKNKGVLSKDQSENIKPLLKSKVRRKFSCQANGNIDPQKLRNRLKLSTSPGTCCIKANLSPTKLILKYKEDKSKMASVSKSKIRDKNLFESFANMNGMNSDLSLKGHNETGTELKHSNLVCEMDSSKNKIKLKISNNSENPKSSNHTLTCANSLEDGLSHFKRTRFSTESGIDVVFDSSETSTPEHSSGVDVQTSDSGLECNLVACKKLEFKNKNGVCDENCNKGNNIVRSEAIEPKKPTIACNNKADNKRNIFQVLEEETSAAFGQSSKTAEKLIVPVNTVQSPVVIESSESDEDIEIRELHVETLNEVMEGTDKEVPKQKVEASDEDEDIEVREISDEPLENIPKKCQDDEIHSSHIDNHSVKSASPVCELVNSPEMPEITGSCNEPVISRISGDCVQIEPTGVIIDQADLLINDSEGVGDLKDDTKTFNADNFQCAFLQYVSGNGSGKDVTGEESTSPTSPDLPNCRTTSMVITKRRNVETLKKKYSGQGVFINILPEESQEEIDVCEKEICVSPTSSQMSIKSKRSGKKRKTRSGECRLSSSNDSDNSNDSDSRLSVRRKKKRIRTQSSETQEKSDYKQTHSGSENNPTCNTVRHQPSRRVRHVSYTYDTDSSDSKSQIEENKGEIHHDCRHEDTNSDTEAYSSNTEESQAEDELSEDSSLFPIDDKDPDWAPSSKVNMTSMQDDLQASQPKLSPRCVKNKSISHQHSSHRLDLHDSSIKSRLGRKRAKTKGMCPCCIGMSSPIKRTHVKPASSLKRGRYKYLSAVEEGRFIEFTRQLITTRWLFHRLLSVLFPQFLPLLRKINPESWYFDRIVDEVEEIIKCSNTLSDLSPSNIYENNENWINQGPFFSVDRPHCEKIPPISRGCAIHAILPKLNNCHKSTSLTSPLNILIPDNPLCYQSDQDTSNSCTSDAKTLNNGLVQMSEMETMLQQCISQCSDINNKSNNLTDTSLNTQNNPLIVSLNSENNPIVASPNSENNSVVTSLNNSENNPVVRSLSSENNPVVTPPTNCGSCDDSCVQNLSEQMVNGFPAKADGSLCESAKYSVNSDVICENQSNSSKYHEENIIENENEIKSNEKTLDAHTLCDVNVFEQDMSISQGNAHGTCNESLNNDKDNKPVKHDNIFDIFTSDTYCIKCGKELFTTYHTLCPVCKELESCSKKDKPSNGLSTKKDFLHLINVGDNLNNKLQCGSKSVLDKLSALVKSDSNPIIDALDLKRKSSSSSEAAEEIGPTSAILDTDVMFPVSADSSLVGSGIDSSQIELENNFDGENPPSECLSSSNFTNIIPVDSDETIEASLNKDLNVSDLNQICETKPISPCVTTSGHSSLTDTPELKTGISSEVQVSVVTDTPELKTGISSEVSVGGIVHKPPYLEPCKIIVCRTPVSCLKSFQIKVHNIITQLFPDISSSISNYEKSDSLEYLLQSLIDVNTKCTCNLSLSSDDTDFRGVNFS